MAGWSEGTLLSAIVRPKRRPLGDHMEMYEDLLLQDRHQNVFCRAFPEFALLRCSRGDVTLKI